MANRNNNENYTKPGDDKIVSGKGFLISMPSLKKTNPVKALLGGVDKKKEEAQKNVQKNRPNDKDNKNGGNKNAPQSKQGNEKSIAKQGQSIRHNDKNNGANRPSVHGVVKEATKNVPSNAPQSDKNTRQKDAHNKNASIARKTAAKNDNQANRASNTAAGNQNVTENRDKNQGGKNRDRMRRENRRNKGAKNENPRLQAVEAAISANENSAARQKENTVAPAKSHDNRNDRNDRNRRNQREKLQNYKSAQEPAEANEESKNVGRIESSIVSASPIAKSRSFGKKESAVFGGLSGLFGEKSVRDDVNAKKELEEEPVYVDKNRPLADQIMEDMAKRRGPAKPASVTDTEEKTEIVGVRFRNSGKIYYFAPGNVRVEAGENVIVETARGVEYGFVAIGNTFVKNSKIVSPLKTVVRKATPQDTETYNLHRVFEKMSEHFFRYHVEKLGLEMALVYVEYTFDASKVIFYFTADGRVDFRELIKELAAGYKTRIELRQIGVRDEAKLIGGLGICGRPICCNSFLSEFSQVSIKMAKEQNLFLNSSKISGTCGRFMCCLKFEDESYRKEYEMTPKNGDEVITPEGKGKVMESNAIKGIVSVLLDDRKEELPIEFSREQVQLVNPPKPAQEKAEAPKKQEPSENKPQNVKKVAEGETDGDKNNGEAASGESAQTCPSAEPVKAEAPEAEVTQMQQTKPMQVKESAAGMAVSENNVIVVDEAIESSMKFDGSTMTFDKEETVAVQTTPDKTDGVAFADGVVTYDDTEAEIQKSILEKNVDKAQNADTSDFVISTESASKGEAFADGVITVEE